MQVRALVAMALVALVQGCGDDCVEGTRSIAGRCRKVQAAGNDDFCGDGKLGDGERCDDQNQAPGDGCEVDCTPTPGWSCSGSKCEPLPTGVPTISGSYSLDPALVVWSWRLPDDAASSRVSLDHHESSFENMGAMLLGQDVPEGTYTISVAACNTLGGCGQPAQFTTVVKRYGPSSQPWFRGVKRAFARTVLHGSDAMTAIACQDCFLGPEGETLALDAMTPRLATSLTRGADVVALGVSLIDGQLRISSHDEVTPGDRPELAAFLAESVAKTSDAPLFLEIREIDASPAEFSAALFELLDEHPEFARNGRPLFLRASLSQIDFLDAVESAEANNIYLMNYLRYWVSIPGSDPNWQHAIQAAWGGGYDGVVLDFRDPELFRRVGLAHALGLGVWIDSVPGPGHGDLVLAALREFVDGFTTEYRVDQARAIVEAADTLAFFDASPLTTSAEPLLVHYIDPLNGVVDVWERALQVPSMDNSFGSPELMRWNEDGPLYGGVLDFQAGDRALAFRDTPIGQLDEGLAVSLVTTLGDLDAIPPGTTSMLVGDRLPSARSGFTVALVRASQGGLVLRLSVSLEQTDWTADYPAAGGTGTACDGPTGGTLNGTFVDPLQEDRAYWIALVHDAVGPARLFINGRCAAMSDPLGLGPVRPSLAPPLVGAQPSSTLPGATNYFRGQVQVGQLLSWPSHEADGTN